jgi:hypothetical protein
MNAETEYKNAVAAQREAETALGAISKEDRAAREAAKRLVAEAAERVRQARDAVKIETTVRGFAGVSPNTPLYMACTEQLPAETIGRLEERALEIQRDRSAAAAARRAAKESTAPSPAPPPSREPPRAAPEAPRRRRQDPEILVRRPRAAGGPP